MKTWLSLAAVCLLTARAHAQAPAPPDPQTVFRQRCSDCHVVPDPRRETDRAWLGQVLETS